MCGTPINTCEIKKEEVTDDEVLLELRVITGTPRGETAFTVTEIARGVRELLEIVTFFPAASTATPCGLALSRLTDLGVKA